MSVQDLIDVVKAFFDVILKALEALGWIEPEETTTEGTTAASK